MILYKMAKLAEAMKEQSMDVDTSNFEKNEPNQATMEQHEGWTFDYMKKGIKQSEEEQLLVRR